jgi:hypothetical protein
VTIPAATQEPTYEPRPVFTQGKGTRNPIIQSFTATPTNVTQGQAITFQVLAHDPDRQPLQFNWTATDGTLSTNTGLVVSWIPPAKPGTYTVMVTVTNGRGGFATGAHNLVVQADGSAKIGVTPMASAAPTAQLSPSAIPSATNSPLPSPQPVPSNATSTVASASPHATPSPTAGAATVTTLSGLQSHVAYYDQVRTYNLEAVPGTSTLYFISGHNAPYQSKFGTVDDTKSILPLATSIAGKVSDFAFVGSSLYYLNDSHIGMPDGSLVTLPTDLRPHHLEVVGSHAYLWSSKWSCIYRVDLDTGATTVFAGQKGVNGHVNGSGTEAQFSVSVQNMAYNPVANALFIIDGTRIRKVTMAGEVSDFVGQGGTHGTPPVDGKGSAATLNTVVSLAADDAGNLYFAEFSYGTLHMVSPEGEVTTIAGKPRTTRYMNDGTGTEASFAKPDSITFGKFNDKPALFVSDVTSNGNFVRLVTGW